MKKSFQQFLDEEDEQVIDPIDLPEPAMEPNDQRMYEMLVEKNAQRGREDEMLAGKLHALRGKVDQPERDPGFDHSASLMLKKLRSRWEQPEEFAPLPGDARNSDVAMAVQNKASTPLAPAQTDPWAFMKDMDKARGDLSGESQRRRAEIERQAALRNDSDRGSALGDRMTAMALDFANRPQQASYYRASGDKTTGADKTIADKASFEKWLAGERAGLGQKQAGGIKALEIEDERAKEARKAAGEKDEFGRKTAKDSVDAEMARRKAALDEARLEYDKHHGATQEARMRQAEKNMSEWRLAMLDKKAAEKDEPKKDPRLDFMKERLLNDQASEYGKTVSELPAVLEAVKSIRAIRDKHPTGDMPGVGVWDSRKPNFWNSDDDRDMRRHLDVLKNAILRKESGAAISQSEHDRKNIELGLSPTATREDFSTAMDIIETNTGRYLTNSAARFPKAAIDLYQSRSGTTPETFKRDTSPSGAVKMKVGSSVYAIPESELAAFMKDHPDAVRK